ncbi:MAG: DUF4835 family protein [Salinivirgaceae bacterium]|nr:DUF4835 family protein [Salinivirgaceae bacterium]
MPNRFSQKIILITLFLLSGIFLNAFSQELNCRIQVNSSQIQGTNKTVFEELQKALYEFINSKNWTSHMYSVEERIECNFSITITKQISTDEFEGTIQITSNRPVYNSGYSSPMLNILDDKLHFRYAEGQSLEFNESTHNELTSLIGYYVYVILGFDYDSFSPNGGDEFFQIAEKIVSTAQSSQYGGWKAYESRKNRYWLIENIMNSIYAPIRNYSYVYHRTGLDVMSKNTTDGRAAIIAGLQDLLKVHRQKPNSFLMQTFFETKSGEIIKVVQEGPTSEGMRAYNILKEVNPSKSSEYENIIKRN